MKESVGILIVAKDTKNFLLLHRSQKPIVWSILTGTMDVEGETPLETVKREIEEEINLDSSKVKDIKKVGVIETQKKLFHVFVGFLDKQIDLNLKLDENDEFKWTNVENIPSPMHKRWEKTFQLAKPYLNLKETVIRIVKSLLNG